MTRSERLGKHFPLMAGAAAGLLLLATRSGRWRERLEADATAHPTTWVQRFFAFGVVYLIAVPAYIWLSETDRVTDPLVKRALRLVGIILTLVLAILAITYLDRVIV